MKATTSALLAQILVCFTFLIPGVRSYYSGESVDTIVYTQNGRLDSLKAQRPLFGLDSSSRFDRKKITRLSLGFEEGFHQISYVDTTNLGKIRVRFVYSRSGAGAIHSVSSEPIAKSSNEQYSEENIEVEYIWVEEEPIDIQSGAIVMFAATLCVSILFLLQACGLSDDAAEQSSFDRNPLSSSWNPHSE